MIRPVAAGGGFLAGSGQAQARRAQVRQDIEKPAGKADMLHSAEIVVLWRIIEMIHCADVTRLRGLRSVAFLHDADAFFAALKTYGFELADRAPDNFLDHSHVSSSVAGDEVVLVVDTPIWSVDGNATDVFVEIEIRRSTDTVYVIRGHDVM